MLRRYLSDRSTFSLSNHTHILDFIRIFYEDLHNSRNEIVDDLFKQSIYVPVILHFIHVLGPESVMVLTVDQIIAASANNDGRNSKERSKYTFQQVYKFMNLRSYDM